MRGPASRSSCWSSSSASSFRKLADYRAVADYIQGIEPFEWLLLAVFAGWFLIAYVFVFMATLPSLRFKEGFVVQTTATAINNSLPAGGAIALPITYSQFLSWGFTPGAVTAALLTAGVWDQLARQALPVLAVAVIALLGEAVWWMWLVSIVGVISVAIWIGVLTVILRSESAAEGFGRWLNKVVNWFTKKFHREPGRHGRGDPPVQRQRPARRRASMEGDHRCDGRQSRIDGGAVRRLAPGGGRVGG